MRSVPRDAANQLLGQILAADVDLITNDRFETDATLPPRAAALQPLYLAHESGFTNTADARQAIARKKLGPKAQALAADLTAALDLETGLWHGQKVDAAVLDGLVAAGDETTLLRCVRLLPSQALRLEARRRVIDLHVKASRFPEVRANAAHIEQEMMGGTHPISVKRHPVASVKIDLPSREGRVEQDLVQQTARLLGAQAVLPEVALRGLLQVTVEGISQPVTLCGEARDLDPSPCILPGDLQLRSDFAQLDSSGTVHFLENMSAAQANALAREQELQLPISIGGRPAVTLAFPLRFALPQDLVLQARPRGAGRIWRRAWQPEPSAAFCTKCSRERKPIWPPSRRPTCGAFTS